MNLYMSSYYNPLVTHQAERNCTLEEGGGGASKYYPSGAAQECIARRYLTLCFW